MANKSVQNKKNSNAKNKKNTAKTKAKLSPGAILICVVIIIALIVGVTVFRDEVGEAIRNLGGDGGTYQINPSVLGGSTAVSLPSEIGEIGLEVHYIDVGQGDSIVVRFPDGKDMIIDAGSGTTASNATVAKYLDYLELIEIDYFDYMVATHPHADHINMLDDVLDKYEVREIYYNDYAVDSATYRTFENKAIAEGAVLHLFDDDGDTYTITGGDYKVTIYSPGYARFTQDDNDMSPIIVIEYRSRRLIFMGDAETPVEKWFIDQFSSFDCDVIKIGHHGSSSSSSPEFLQFITVEYAVIMVAETNTYTHPNPFTMNTLFNMGIVTYRTNRHGNIVLYIDKDGNMAFGVDNVVPTENNKYLRNDLMIVPQE